MLSGIVTSILLLLFLVGWAWAWSPRRKADFDAAAKLPFDDLPADEWLPPAKSPTETRR